jgi:DNA repair protein RecN (Recombination protein N)
MLSSLLIESLGLIDKYSFSFKDGFTSITGETGSGKTSLIEALKLTLGKKSDFEFIKKGEKKASIKASFELKPSHPIYPLLLENGFLIERGEAIIITRQLSTCGKSKAFVNDQPISLTLLAKLSVYLCDFIDQDSLLETKKEDYFLHLLDKTGPYESLLKDYKQVYESFDELSKKYKTLKKHQEGKEFKVSLIEEEIKELKEASILPEEETALFETYKKALGLQGKMQTLESYISGFNQAILPQLRKMRMDKVFNEEQKALLESAFINLCEVSSHLEATIDEGNFSPSELLKMEERLKLIHSLKRKYNVESDQFEHILALKTKELDFLFSIDEELEKLQKILSSSQIDLNSHAEKLSNERAVWAKKLQENLTSHLRPLNMPYAELLFTFKETHLSESGKESVDLLLKANAASNLVPLHQGASGGELARVNFCFFLETSKLHEANTYVFDEIDASVGGMTSALMGDKLKVLADEKQVFCITHFPQMAQKATNHLVFEKKQDESGTFIDIMHSTNGPIESEIERMIGVKE